MAKKRSRKKKIPLTPQQWFTSLLVTVALAFAAWVIEEWPAEVTLPSSEKPVALYAKEAHDDLRATMLSAIRSAQTSVALVIYTLHDNAIIKALRDKAQEGVPVFVVLDLKGSPDAKEKLGPRVTVRERKGAAILHQKMLVIDNARVWIGSANMTYSSLRLYGNLVFGLDSPPLAHFVSEKIHSLPPKGKGPTFPTQTFGFAEQQGELHFLPDDKEASDKVKQCLRTAEKTVRVAMFTFTREDFADELIACSRRGVDTEVVIDLHQGQGTGAKIVDYLREHGIKTALSRGDALLHHKFCYIDGKTLLNGSANWTKAAFTTNDDFFMVLAPLTEEQHEKMEQIWNNIISEADPV